MSTQNLLLECLNSLPLKETLASLHELRNASTLSHVVGILLNKECPEDPQQQTTLLEGLLKEHFSSSDLIDYKEVYNGNETEISKLTLLLLYVTLISSSTFQQSFIEKLILSQSDEFKLKHLIASVQNRGHGISKKYLDILIKETYDLGKIHHTPVSARRYLDSPTMYSSSPKSLLTQSPLKELLQSPPFQMKKLLSEKTKELKRLQQQIYLLEGEKQDIEFNNEIHVKKQNKYEKEIEKLKEQVKDLRKNCEHFENRIVLDEAEGNKQIIQLRKDISMIRSENDSLNETTKKVLDENFELSNKIGNLKNRLILTEAEKVRLSEEVLNLRQSCSENDTLIEIQGYELQDFKKQLEELQNHLLENKKGFNKSIEESFEGLPPISLEMSTNAEDTSTMETSQTSDTEGENLGTAVVEKWLCEARLQCEVLQSDKKELLSQIEVEKGHNDQIQQELKVTQKKCSEQEEELITVKEELECLKTQSEKQILNMKENLELLRENYSSEKQMLLDQIENLRKECIIKEQNYERTHQEFANLKENEIQELKEKMVIFDAESKNAMKLLKEEIESLTIKSNLDQQTHTSEMEKLNALVKNSEGINSNMMIKLANIVESSTTEKQMLLNQVAKLEDVAIAKDKEHERALSELVGGSEREISALKENALKLKEESEGRILHLSKELESLKEKFQSEEQSYNLKIENLFANNRLCDETIKSLHKEIKEIKERGSTERDRLAEELEKMHLKKEELEERIVSGTKQLELVKEEMLCEKKLLSKQMEELEQRNILKTKESEDTFNSLVKEKENELSILKEHTIKQENEWKEKLEIATIELQTLRESSSSEKQSLIKQIEELEQRNILKTKECEDSFNSLVKEKENELSILKEHMIKQENEWKERIEIAKIELQTLSESSSSEKQSLIKQIEDLEQRSILKDQENLSSVNFLANEKEILLSNLKEEMSKLEMECEKRVFKVTQELESVKELSLSEKESLGLKIRQLEEKCESLKKENEISLNALRSEKEMDCSLLKESIVKMKEDSENNLRILGEERKLKDVALLENKALLEQMDKLGMKVKDSETKVSSVEDEISAIKTKAQTEEHNLKVKIDELNMNKAQSEVKILNLESELKTLKSEVEIQLHSYKSEMMKAEENWCQKDRELRTNLDTVKSDLTKAEEQVVRTATESQNRLLSLEQERKHKEVAESEKQALSKEIGHLSKQKEKYELKISKIEEEVQNLKMKAESDKQSYKEEIESAKAVAGLKEGELQTYFDAEILKKEKELSSTKEDNIKIQREFQLCYSKQKDEMETLRKQVLLAQTAEQKYKKELEREKASAAIKETELQTSLKVEIGKKEKELSLAKSDIMKIQSESDLSINNLKNEIETLKKEVWVAQTAQQKNEDELAKVTASATIKEKELQTSLQAEIVKKERELSSAKVELNEIRSKSELSISKLNVELETLTKKLLVTETSLQNYKDELGRLKASTAVRENELQTSLETEVLKKERELSSAKEDLIRIQSESELSVSKLKDEIEALTKQVLLEQAELQESREELEKTKSSSAIKEKELHSSYKTKILKKETELSSIKVELNEIRSKSELSISKLNVELETLTKKLLVTETSQQNYKDELGRLKASTAVRENELQTSLETEVLKKERELSSAKDDLIRIQSESELSVSKLKDEIEALTKQVLLEQAELQESREELEKTKSSSAVKEKELHSSYETEILKKETELSSIKEEIIKIRNDSDTNVLKLREEMQSLIEERSTLTKRIAALEEDLLKKEKENQLLLEMEKESRELQEKQKENHLIVEARLIDKEKEVSNAKEDVMRVERESEKSIKSLQEEIISMKEKVQSEKHKMKSSYKEKMDSILAKVKEQEKVQEELNLMKQKYEKAKIKLMENISQLNDASTAMVNYQKQVIKYKDHVTKVTETLNKEKEIKEELTARLNKLEEERLPLKDKLAEMDKTAKRLQTEKRSLEAQLAMADSSIRDIQKQIKRESLGGSRLSLMRGHSKTQPSSTSSNGEELTDDSRTLLIPDKKGKRQTTSKTILKEEVAVFQKPALRLRSSMKIPDPQVTRERYQKTDNTTLNPHKKVQSQASLMQIPKETGRTRRAVSAASFDKRNQQSTGIQSTLSKEAELSSSDRMLSSLSHGRSVPREMMSLFNCEDEEEGDFSNNKYLADLKYGRCNLNADFDWRRVSELQRRNSLYPPHMRSAYPAEMQFQPSKAFTDDQLRAGCAVDDARVLDITEAAENLEINSPPAFNLRKRKSSDSFNSQSPLSNSTGRKTKRLSTSYSRPGPPTPGKRSHSRNNEKENKSDPNESWASTASTTSKESKLSFKTHQTPQFRRLTISPTTRSMKSPPSSLALRSSKGVSPANKKGRTPSSILKIISKAKSPWTKLSNDDTKGLGDSTESSGSSKLRIFRKRFGFKNYDVLSASMRAQEGAGQNDSIESGRIINPSMLERKSKRRSIKN